jgi:hypothetical protein
MSRSRTTARSKPAHFPFSRPPTRYFGLTALHLRIRRAVSNLEKAFFATAKQQCDPELLNSRYYGTAAIG